MKLNKFYILYIYVSNEQTLNKQEARESKMSVLNTYDINAKANEISEDLKKMDASEDKSEILFEEMRIMAVNNMQRFNLGLYKKTT